MAEAVIVHTEPHQFITAPNNIAPPGKEGRGGDLGVQAEQVGRALPADAVRLTLL